MSTKTNTDHDDKKNNSQEIKIDKSINNLKTTKQNYSYFNTDGLIAIVSIPNKNDCFGIRTHNIDDIDILESIRIKASNCYFPFGIKYKNNRPVLKFEMNKQTSSRVNVIEKAVKRLFLANVERIVKEYEIELDNDSINDHGESSNKSSDKSSKSEDSFRYSPSFRRENEKYKPLMRCGLWYSRGSGYKTKIRGNNDKPIDISQLPGRFKKQFSATVTFRLLWIWVDWQSGRFGTSWVAESINKAND